MVMIMITILILTTKISEKTRPKHLPRFDVDARPANPPIDHLAVDSASIIMDCLCFALLLMGINEWRGGR